MTLDHDLPLATCCLLLKDSIAQDIAWFGLDLAGKELHILFWNPSLGKTSEKLFYSSVCLYGSKYAHHPRYQF